jgi:hypothetical protein
MVLEFAKRYDYKEENVAFSVGSIRALATQMWDKMPSSHLFAQTRALANIHAKQRAQVRSRERGAEEDFMALVKEAEIRCPLTGEKSFHAQKKNAAVKSLAEYQHPKYKGELLVGRVEQVEADKLTKADLHIDLTKPPCNPGDLEYVARIPFAGLSKAIKAYNGQAGARKYVDRYCGHTLRSVEPRVDISVENILGDSNKDDDVTSEKLIHYRMNGGTEGKGCQRSVRAGAAHDLYDICSHVPSYSDEGFDQILLAGQRFSSVEFQLGPKLNTADTRDERSVKLRHLPTTRENMLERPASGTFQVSTGKNRKSGKKSLSPLAQSPQSIPGTSLSNNKPEWDSDGMMLPGFQRKVGIVPEVNVFPITLQFV